MQKISILGCGWLGLPLATALAKKGNLIKGSTTSTDKITLLTSAGIAPFLIYLHENKIDGAFTTFLENSQILLIDIPPKLRGNHSENFVQKIQNCIPFIEKSSIKKVLFVSSTSVYGDDNSIANESTIPNPTSESGKQLLKVEQLLSNNANFSTTIIRFAGLIGPNRHPITSLSGKKGLENPEAPINLIDQTDCIGIIEKIIKGDFWGEIFNGVAPFHPTRKDYYTQEALKRNLPLPEFNESGSVGKLIVSHKIEQKLGYEFK